MASGSARQAPSASSMNTNVSMQILPDDGPTIRPRRSRLGALARLGGLALPLQALGAGFVVWTWRIMDYIVFSELRHGRLDSAAVRFAVGAGIGLGSGKRDHRAQHGRVAALHLAAKRARRVCRACRERRVRARGHHG